MKERFIILDVFRGIAAIIVAIYHFSRYKGTIGTMSVVENGYRFVDFFFVLSGFIIYHTYRDMRVGKEQYMFLYKRILRLYPLHVTLLLVFLAFEILKDILFKYGFFNNPAFSINTPVKFIINLFMLQGFAESSSDYSWNYPSWSIGAEMIAYIIFAIIIVRINSLFPPLKILILLFLSFISLFLYSVWSSYLNAPLECIFGFFIGCITYECYIRLILKLNRYSVLFFSIFEIISLIILFSLVSYLHKQYSSLLTVTYAVTILIFAFERGVVSRGLNIDLLKRTGDLSYSIYMVHAIVATILNLIILKKLASSTLLIDILTILFVITVWVLAFYTHKYIELKGRKYLAHLLESIRIKVNNMFYGSSNKLL